MHTRATIGVRVNNWLGYNFDLVSALQVHDHATHWIPSRNGKTWDYHYTRKEAKMIEEATSRFVDDNCRKCIGFRHAFLFFLHCRDSLGWSIPVLSALSSFANFRKRSIGIGTGTGISSNNNNNNTATRKICFDGKHSFDYLCNL